MGIGKRDGTSPDSVAVDVAVKYNAVNLRVSGACKGRT